MSTVEVVIITPVMFTFVLLLVAMGFYVENIGKVQSAAQDAARMASLQRSTAQQKFQASKVATADLGATCNGSGGLELKVKSDTIAVPPNNDPKSAATTVPTVDVTVTCHVSVFGASYAVTESSYAPINVYSGQK